MNLNDTIKLAYKSFRRNKSRFMIIRSVVIGIFALELLVSLNLGLQKNTSARIATIDLQTILVFISGIGFLIALFSIANAMAILLRECTHEIGIMKAVGATSKDIRRLFFWESALIGIFGGFLGVIIAVSLGLLFNAIIGVLIKDSGQRIDLFVASINFSIGIIIFSVIISVLSGLYPAHRAQKLLPIDALRQ